MLLILSSGVAVDSVAVQILETQHSTTDGAKSWVENRRLTKWALGEELVPNPIFAAIEIYENLLLVIDFD
jgi:hypothetical protein